MNAFLIFENARGNWKYSYDLVPLLKVSLFEWLLDGFIHRNEIIKIKKQKINDTLQSVRFASQRKHNAKFTFVSFVNWMNKLAIHIASKFLRQSNTFACEFVISATNLNILSSIIMPLITDNTVFPIKGFFARAFLKSKTFSRGRNNARWFAFLKRVPAVQRNIKLRASQI